MDFIPAVKAVIGKYATFSGRARRSEYWWFILFYEIVLAVALMVDVAVFGSMALFYGLASLALLLPVLGVLVRRLHDIDRSGWWSLIVLAPIVGAILLLIWLCKKGTEGANRFGDDPLLIGNGA